MQRRVPDIAKAHRILGWQPSRDLNQIIDDIADFVRANHSHQLESDASDDNSGVDHR
jgi:nucleoside-diphosphate-sugar epimerase